LIRAGFEDSNRIGEITVPTNAALLSTLRGLLEKLAFRINQGDVVKHRLLNFPYQHAENT